MAVDHKVLFSHEHVHNGNRIPFSHRQPAVSPFSALDLLVDSTSLTNRYHTICKITAYCEIVLDCAEGCPLLWYPRALGARYTSCGSMETQPLAYQQPLQQTYSLDEYLGFVGLAPFRTLGAAQISRLLPPSYDILLSCCSG